MSDDRTFERAARDWLETGPLDAPDRVVQAALLEIDGTAQERAALFPWRFPTMPTFARVIAAVIVIAAATGLAVLMQRPSPERAAAPPATQPAVVPSTGVAASPPAQPSATARTLDLSSRWSSERYGYSIAIDPHWTVTPALLTWSGPDNSPPVMDEIAVAGTDTGIAAASQPLQPGQTFDQWLDTFQPASSRTEACKGGDPATWPMIEIGVEPGLWQQMCNAGEAVVEDSGRAYVFSWWGKGALDDRQHLSMDEFTALLQTVKFDAASVPKSSPALAEAFVSTRNGYSLHYPGAWSVKQATAPADLSIHPRPTDQSLDVLSNDTVRILITSGRLPNGSSTDTWAQQLCLLDRTVWTPPCDSAPAGWLPVDIGGTRGWIMIDGVQGGSYVPDTGRLFEATTVVDGRAYVIRADGLLDHQLFSSILGSMTLDPKSAVDARPAP